MSGTVACFEVVVTRGVVVGMVVAETVVVVVVWADMTWRVGMGEGLIVVDVIVVEVVAAGVVVVVVVEKTDAGGCELLCGR